MATTDCSFDYLFEYIQRFRTNDCVYVCDPVDSELVMNVLKHFSFNVFGVTIRNGKVVIMLLDDE